MSRSDKKIVRKAINWCKSVKKNIGKFSYELDKNIVDSLLSSSPKLAKMVNLLDYITLNVPPRAFSNVPLQIWSL